MRIARLVRRVHARGAGRNAGAAISDTTLKAEFITAEINGVR